MSTTLPDLRAALAELGIALHVLRASPSGTTVDGLELPSGMLPIAVVWDDNPLVLRSRIRAAIGRLSEQNPVAPSTVAKAS